jgi:hypothetical protein
MAEPHDLLKARRESAALLGLGDVERLSPADTLRCDLISTLRLAIDGEQATVLDRGAADLAKLITATENLIRLLPGHELPEPKPADGGPSDPRRIMFENYKRMRERGAAFGEGYDGLKLENERLRARVAELEAGETIPRVPGASTGGQIPPVGGSNVVPLSKRTTEASKFDNLSNSSKSEKFADLSPPAAAPKPAPAAGIITDSADEPWRPFVGGGAHYDRWSNRN